MNNSTLRRSAVFAGRLAVATIFLFHPAPAQAAVISCPHTNQEADKWINRAVEDLVRSAYAAYRSESAQTRHRRVVDGLADTVQRCRLAEDCGICSAFAARFGYLQIL